MAKIPVSSDVCDEDLNTYRQHTKNQEHPTTLRLPWRIESEPRFYSLDRPPSRYTANACDPRNFYFLVQIQTLQTLRVVTHLNSKKVFRARAHAREKKKSATPKTPPATTQTPPQPPKPPPQPPYAVRPTSLGLRFSPKGEVPRPSDEAQKTIEKGRKAKA